MFSGDHFDNSHNLISLDDALLLKKESGNEEGHLFASLSWGGGGVKPIQGRGISIQIGVFFSCP